MNAFQRISIWLLSLGLALAASGASAYSYVMMEDAELFDTSEGVVVARVLRAVPAIDGDSETRYELRVLDVLSGPKLAAHEVLVLPGTFDAPSLNLVIDGIPRLQQGGTILLFHARRHDGMLQAMQLSLGLFGQVETDEGRFYVRHLEGERDLGKSATRQRYHAPRAAAAFEHWLGERARGIDREPDYLRPKLEIGSDAKFTFGQFNFGGNPPNGPGRWFQFDTDQTMSWRATPGGQANTAFDEFASLTQALAAWTNDPNSRILLSNAGTQADPPLCNNPQPNQPSNAAGAFSGHVCWNDPNGLVAGSVTCPGGSGTLGIGGSYVSTPSQMFNGMTWYPRSFAFVVINDNAGCFMDDNNGADGAELLTHEVGHTLAFGHSCGDGNSPACNSNVDLNQAVMRATAHGDGRGAQLGVDDRAAAAVAYPQPGGDVTPPTVPTNLAASPTSPASVNVSWSASNDGGGSGLAGYELERCEGAGCNAFAEISEQASTNFTDSTVSGATTYRYRVRAFDMVGNRSAYSTVADAVTPALTTGVAVTALAGADNSQRFFTLNVPPGATNLVFQTSGGSGDADLYVRFGSRPTTVTFDCRSQLGTNAELCTIPLPQTGTYHVMVLGFDAYTDVSLVGSYSVLPACIGNCVFRSGFEQ